MEDPEISTPDWQWIFSKFWIALQAGSVLIVLVCAGIILTIFLNLREGRRYIGTPDYAGFYSAAVILNEYPAARLYDLELQDRILHERVPGIEKDGHYPYAHTPALAFIVRPLARLPFAWSYIIWEVVLVFVTACSFCFCNSFLSLNRAQQRAAILFATAFFPLVFECWVAGQYAVFGMFWISLALWLLARERQLLSGAALAMCLVKPTLMMFVLPVILVSGSKRFLLGVVVGGSLLGATCLIIVGIEGAFAYADMLTTYSHHMSDGAQGFKTFKHVDLHSFFVMLYGGPGWAAKLSVSAVAAIFVPALLAAWWFQAKPQSDGMVLALCATLSGNLILSAYTPIYDVTLIIPSVLMTHEVIRRRSRELPKLLIPIMFKFLVGSIICASWFTQILAEKHGFQPLTLVLAAWAFFQLHLALAFKDPSTKEEVVQSTPNY